MEAKIKKIVELAKGILLRLLKTSMIRTCIIQTFPNSNNFQSFMKNILSIS